MRFVKYVGVQFVAYALDMGTFLLAFHLGHLPALVANVAGKLVAGGFAFFAHRAFTFESQQTGTVVKHGVRYALLLAANIPISSAVFWVLLRLREDETMTKFAADVICVALTYWLSKHLVFTQAAVEVSTSGEGR